MALLFLIVTIYASLYIVEVLVEKYLGFGHRFLKQSLAFLIIGILTFVFNHWFETGVIMLNYGVVPNVATGDEYVKYIVLALISVGFIGLLLNVIFLLLKILKGG